jgi:hypothetical protein
MAALMLRFLSANRAAGTAAHLHRGAPPSGARLRETDDAFSLFYKERCGVVWCQQFEYFKG